MRKGNITVFSALCMMFIVSVLFFLLEAARFCGLERYAEWKSRQGIECAAAEYQPYLWEAYDLLMLDGAYAAENFDIGKLSGRVYSFTGDNLKGIPQKWCEKGMDLFQMKISHIYEPQYLLVTDDEGNVFLDLLASRMKKELPQKAAEKIYESYLEKERQKQDAGDIDRVFDAAKESMETAAAENGEEKELPKIEENPIEIAEEIKEVWNLSTLALVISDTEKISAKKIDLKQTLGERIRQEGNKSYNAEHDWYRKILALEYADSNFSCYTKKMENHAFSYEIEYLIAGKGEERENLEKVVNQMLLYRFAANVTYLLKDRQKMGQADAIAAALMGFTGNPAIIKTVQTAVIGAWAFLEGIQDVRALLQGGKIAVIKSAGQWTTDIFHLTQSFQMTSRAKECENGLTYEEYLKQMLFFVKDEKLAYRMLDMMEQGLRTTELYKNCRMDHMIVSFDCKIIFSAEPLFSSMSFIGTGLLKQFCFEKEKSFSYIP